MPSFEWDLPYGLRRIPTFARNVVATTQPLAAQAGIQMLQQGGNAVDAAVATAITLTIVEPVSCGLGSDGFAMVWDGARLHGLNATGRSPAATRGGHFVGIDSMPWTGWETVTVPGAVSAWVALSKRFGRLPFARLFEPAVNYGRYGFVVTPTIAKLWGSLKLVFRRYPDILNTYYRGGDPPEAGAVVRLPDHANTLEVIAASDGEAFYRGGLAERIAEYARASGGCLSREDLERHSADWVEPLSVSYRGFELHELPPNAQGLAALVALGVLEQFDLASCPLESADSLHLQIEAMKIGFADLYQHVADPAVMRVDLNAFLDASYLKRRASDISLIEARFPQSLLLTDVGTTYVAAADADGMMVSYIQSSGRGFGSGLVVPGTGIALPARGHWFSLTPGHPNEIGPRKRPVNTNIPAFLTHEGRPVACFGLMGANAQPQVHVQFVTRLVDYEQNPQAAVDAARWRIAMNEPAILLEQGVRPETRRALEERGHLVVETEKNFPAAGTPFGSALFFGAAQMIYRLADGYIAASDARRDGQAVGY